MPKESDKDDTGAADKADMDERLKLDMDPEDALRVLLRTRPKPRPASKP